MEAVVERENIQRAYKRVIGNKGAAGVDGITAGVLGPFLKSEWARIKEE